MTVPYRYTQIVTGHTAYYLQYLIKHKFLKSRHIKTKITHNYLLILFTNIYILPYRINTYTVSYYYIKYCNTTSKTIKMTQLSFNTVITSLISESSLQIKCSVKTENCPTHTVNVQERSLY